MALSKPLFSAGHMICPFYDGNVRAHAHIVTAAFIQASSDTAQVCLGLLTLSIYFIVNFYDGPEEPWFARQGSEFCTVHSQALLHSATLKDRRYLAFWTPLRSSLRTGVRSFRLCETSIGKVVLIRNLVHMRFRCRTR